jgi:hypothetical protein
MTLPDGAANLQQVLDGVDSVLGMCLIAKDLERKGLGKERVAGRQEDEICIQRDNGMLHIYPSRSYCQ